MGKKYKRYQRKVDQTHTRKRKQPQGISGKFMQLPDVRTRDLRLYLKREVRDCLVRMPECQVGRMDGNVWLIGLHMQDDTNTLYYRKAVELFWEEGRKEIKRDERIKRTCRTVGCMNESHYVLIKKEEREMVNDGQARAFYDKAMREDEAILPLGDAQKAKTLRMNIYTRRAHWKRHDPMYYAMIENYGLFLEGGNLVCRKHGMELDSLFAAAGLAPSTHIPRAQRDVEAEIKRAVNATATAPGNDVMSLYSPTTSAENPVNKGQEVIKQQEHVQTCFNYDECYAKATAYSGGGAPLTQSEEALLEAGPEPERRE